MGSKGGGGGGGYSSPAPATVTPTTSTTTSSIPPEVLANYQAIVSAGQKVASQPLQQYGGPMLAGFTPQQNAGFSGVNNAVGSYQPYFNQANGLVNNATTFNPSTLQQYMSPYTNDVIKSTMDLAHQNDAQQQQALTGNAISKGAWGGDRAGVAAAALAGQQQLADNATIANLENQNYAQGLGAMQNANAQQLTGASTLGTMGNAAQANNLAGASAQLQAGQLQQTQAQNALNIPYEQFQQQQQYPFQTTGWLANIVEGLGANQGGSSTTTTKAMGGAVGYADGGHVVRLAGGGVPSGNYEIVPAPSINFARADLPKSEAGLVEHPNVQGNYLSQGLGALGTVAGLGKDFGWWGGGANDPNTSFMANTAVDNSNQAMNAFDLSGGATDSGMLTNIADPSSVSSFSNLWGLFSDGGSISPNEAWKRGGSIPMHYDTGGVLDSNPLSNTGLGSMGPLPIGATGQSTSSVVPNTPVYSFAPMNAAARGASNQSSGINYTPSAADISAASAQSSPAQSSSNQILEGYTAKNGQVQPLYSTFTPSEMAILNANQQNQYDSTAHNPLGMVNKYNGNPPPDPSTVPPGKVFAGWNADGTAAYGNIGTGPGGINVIDTPIPEQWQIDSQLNSAKDVAKNQLAGIKSQNAFGPADAILGGAELATALGSGYALSLPGAPGMFATLGDKAVTGGLQGSNNGSSGILPGAGLSAGTSAAKYAISAANGGAIGRYDDGGGIPQGVPTDANNVGLDPMSPYTQAFQQSLGSTAQPSSDPVNTAVQQITQASAPSAPASPEDTGLGAYQNMVPKPDWGQALTTAGLAMMAGKSPSALANIGEGGQAGMKNYEEQKANQRDAQAKAVEMAQKAESLQVGKMQPVQGQDGNWYNYNTKNGELNPMQANGQPVQLDPMSAMSAGMGGRGGQGMMMARQYAQIHKGDAKYQNPDGTVNTELLNSDALDFGASRGQSQLAGSIAENKKTGAGYGGLMTQYVKEASAAQETQASMAQLQNEAKNTPTGWGAPLKAKANAILASIGGTLGVPVDAQASMAGNAQAFNKGAMSMTINAAKNSSERAFAALQAIGTAYPNLELTPQGMSIISAGINGSSEYKVAKLQAAQAWINDPSNKNSMKGFEPDFQKNVTPFTFVLHNMGDDERNQFIANMSQDKAGKAELAKLADESDYAEKNGLFK